MRRGYTRGEGRLRLTDADLRKIQNYKDGKATLDAISTADLTMKDLLKKMNDMGKLLLLIINLIADDDLDTN